MEEMKKKFNKIIEESSHLREDDVFHCITSQMVESMKMSKIETRLLEIYCFVLKLRDTFLKLS
jgi:hypothetical protein